MNSFEQRQCLCIQIVTFNANIPFDELSMAYFDRAESTELEGHEQHSLAEEVLADLADLSLMFLLDLFSR